MPRHRESFSVQLQAQHGPTRGGGGAGRRGSTYAQRFSIAEAIGSETDEVTAPFTSKIAPTEMRQLALVAHNHMKPAMKQFIETYSEILKKFRITGTQTTMKMCKSMWGEDDPNIHYGLTCTSGPLGGDAQIAALMCMEDLGALIFFVDPLSAHPHQADIDSLIRLSNCGNIIVCPNPASASSMMHTLRCALLKGDRARGMIPSFFETLESPAVEEYKHQQALALANVSKGNSPAGAPVGGAAAPQAPKEVDSKDEPEVVNISDSQVERALLGESLAVNDARLQAILNIESDDDSDSDDESGEEELGERRGRVSMGLFGIKTKTEKTEGRNELKKLGKSVRNMFISE